MGILTVYHVLVIHATALVTDVPVIQTFYAQNVQKSDFYDVNSDMLYNHSEAEERCKSREGSWALAWSVPLRYIHRLQKDKDYHFGLVRLPGCDVLTTPNGEKPPISNLLNETTLDMSFYHCTTIRLGWANQTTTVSPNNCSAKAGYICHNHGGSYTRLLACNETGRFFLYGNATFSRAKIICSKTNSSLLSSVDYLNVTPEKRRSWKVESTYGEQWQGCFNSTNVSSDDACESQHMFICFQSVRASEEEQSPGPAQINKTSQVSILWTVNNEICLNTTHILSNYEYESQQRFTCFHPTSLQVSGPGQITTTTLRMSVLWTLNYEPCKRKSHVIQPLNRTRNDTDAVNKGHIKMEMDRKNASLYRRKKTCAYDDRFSSRALGYTSILVLCTFVGIIVLLDLSACLMNSSSNKDKAFS